MLQTQTVDPYTLELLRRFMSQDWFHSFNLVGGTALSLQLGHRISIDLDFFSFKEFDVDILKEKINSTFKDVKREWTYERGMILTVRMNDVKVDFVHYPYELIDTLVIEKDIRLLSPKDIAAMKLSAVSNRAEKKDFFDIYKLLQTFTLKEMLALYRVKFKQEYISHILRSLCYFDEANESEDPIMIDNTTWNDVKNRVQSEVKDYFLKKEQDE